MLKILNMNQFRKFGKKLRKIYQIVLIIYVFD